MNMKRLTLLFLSLVMVLSCVVAVPFSAAAAEATGADEKTAGYQAGNVAALDTTGAVSMTEFAAGTDATLISISTPAEFKLFAELANNLSTTLTDGKYTQLSYTRQNFSGKTVFLTADIDMTGVETLPIGVMAQNEANAVWGTSAYNISFAGTFDGQGYAIENLTMINELAKYPHNTGAETVATATSFGMFGCVRGIIKNLRVVNGSFTSTAQSDYLANGGLMGCAENGVLVENVDFNATVDSKNHNAGGIAGRVNGAYTAKNVTVSGSISSTASRMAGGFGGFSGSAVFNFENCVNNATIKGGEIAGGFMCRVDGGVSTFKNCINNGEILVNAYYENGYVAGFVGALNAQSGKFVGTTHKLTFTNCTNTYADFYALGTRIGGLFADNFYNPYKPIYNATTAEQKSQVTLDNCKHVQLDAGYSEDRVAKVDLTNVFEITAETTHAQITANSKFKIGTPAGLLRFAKLVNENPSGATTGLFNGKTVYLSADIDMAGTGNWVPIGALPNEVYNNSIQTNSDGTYTVLAGSSSTQYHFGGGSIFDGQGHTISNLSSVWTDKTLTNVVGLFGYCPGGGTIRNIVLDASCTIYAGSGISAAGAIVGYNGGICVYNCKSSATVTAANAGGIVGNAFANSNQKGIFYCTNTGTIHGTTRASGMHGGGAVAGTVMNCVNYGTVFAHNGAAAGITSTVRGGGYQIRNNVNYGSVSTRSDAGSASVATVASDGANLEYRCNHNYGSVAMNVNKGTISEYSVINFDATRKTAYEGGTALFTVWGNVDHTAYVGYNAGIINKADTSKLTDIKDVWTIADGKATLKVSAAPRTMKISDAEGMRILSAVVYFGNNLSGYNFFLANDIDMSSLNFNVADTAFADPTTFFPIGYADASVVVGDYLGATPFDSRGCTPTGFVSATYKKFFSGIFDGQGYSIKNWTVDCTGIDETTGGTRIGLFGIADTAIIQNLVFDESNKLTNVSYNGGRWTGVVVECAQTVVHNVWNKADRTFSAEAGVTGGIAAGATQSTFTNCTNDGDISGIHGVGGIVGWGMDSVGVSNCRNNGTISSTGSTDNWVGGMVGTVGHATWSSVPRFINNVNNGKLESNGVKGYLVGHSAGALRVANCADYANDDTVKAIGDKSTNSMAAFGTVALTAMEEQMLAVKYQYGTGENANNVRLVTTVDTLGYQEVGFILTRADGKQAKIVLTTVYNSITGAGETYTPNANGACTSEYFATFTINGVPEGFTVQAYVVTAGGTTIYGNARAIEAPQA